jgi:hypothetical protein
MKIVSTVLFLIGGLAFTGMEFNKGQHQGYIQGCADVMKGLYGGMGITKIDVNSLNTYCEEKWGDRK